MIFSVFCKEKYDTFIALAACLLCILLWFLLFIHLVDSICFYFVLSNSLQELIFLLILFDSKSNFERRHWYQRQGLSHFWAQGNGPMVEIWTRFGHHRPTPTKALLTYTWQRCCHKINQNWSKNDQNWWTRFGQHHPTHTNTILTYTRVLQICSHKISFLLKIKIDKFMIVYMGKELRKIW